MTNKMTAKTNTEAGLPIDPEGSIHNSICIHILLEGITPADSPGHDPEPDRGPGLGLTG